MQLLLSAHPDGMVVGEFRTSWKSRLRNLSHHSEKLKNEAWCASAGKALSFDARQYGSVAGIAHLLVTPNAVPGIKPSNPKKIFQICR